MIAAAGSGTTGLARPKTPASDNNNTEVIALQLVSICSLVISVSSAAAVLVSIWRTGRRYIAGQRCLLRSTLLRTYYKHEHDKELRQYELENFVLCYEAYKALGGNSFADKIYGEVVSWHVTR